MSSATCDAASLRLRYPYLRNPNVKWFKIDVSDLQEMPFQEHELERFAVRSGDVLICEGGEAGRAAIWEHSRTDVKFQKAIHRIRCSSRLFNRYLVHCLMADYQSGRLADYYTGTTIKHLTGQDLATYEFPLPPLAEQRRIAAILDAAEALRAKRRAALAKLDTLTQSIFLEMFGDPARNSQQLRTITLGELGDWHSGGTPPRGKHIYFEGDIPWFSSGELNDVYVTSSKEHLSLAAINETAAKIVPKGSLMLGMYDTAALKASITKVECSCNQAIAFAVIDADRAEAIYVRSAITIGREHFRRLQRGVRQKNLSLSMIREIRIPMPAITKQREYARHLGAHEQLRTMHFKQLAKLDGMFQSLQRCAFRGEL